MTILINPQRERPENGALSARQAEARDRIAADLTALGVRAGGMLLVHSSLSALGHVPGGAETVIRGLLQALGPTGTLLFPTLTYERVTTRNPIFDVRHTRSNVGIIPETFRTRPGSMRSIHPTHSVAAVGALAREMLVDHLLDTTPCGPHSPFHRLPHMGGQILMLGCGLRPNTSMHAIEEIVVPPYLFGPQVPYVLVYPDGKSHEKVYTSHGFRGWRQAYDRVARLLEAPSLSQGPVLQAKAHLLEAEALWAAALDALRRDPFAFVARDAHGRTR
jgi:aminoglycoside 3-N-acetyltransferase